MRMQKFSLGLHGRACIVTSRGVWGRLTSGLAGSSGSSRADSTINPVVSPGGTAADDAEPFGMSATSDAQAYRLRPTKKKKPAQICQSGRPDVRV